MSLFLSGLELFFLISIVLFEYYVIFTFIHSKMGKYPPYIPTCKAIANTIINEVSPLLQNAATPMNIAEPGCGDARIIAALAKKFPQHSFTGYEWDYVPYFFAKIRTKKYKNIRILRQDFMTVDYSKDNVILLFMGDEIVSELSQKLLESLPDKAIILSECFQMPNLTCIKEIETEKKNYFFLPSKLYMYQINKSSEKSVS